MEEKYQADASSAMLMIEVLAIFLRMAWRGKEKKNRKSTCPQASYKQILFLGHLWLI